MNLAKYYQAYLNFPITVIEGDLKRKRYHLAEVFRQIQWHSPKKLLKVAVLGCADRRYIPEHKRILTEILEKSIEITTFDIDAKHLTGAENVVEHDCIKPLPLSPFDIVFSHILLKFIPPKDQWQVIWNAYNALDSNGIAMHFFDVEGKSQASDRLREEFFDVDINEYNLKLKKQRIDSKIIRIKTRVNLTRELDCLVCFKP